MQLFENATEQKLRGGLYTSADSRIPVTMGNVSLDAS